MKLYVLDLGRIIMENDNPVTKDDGTQAQKPQIPIHAFLLDSPAGYILFDVGCDPLGMKGVWQKEMCANPFVYGEDQTLEMQLEAIHVKMEDVRYIVLSHLHLDHAGAVHLFPNAEVFATTLRQVVNVNSHIWGAILLAGDEWHIAQPREIHVLDRIGGGDGFVGGLLYAILKGWDSEKWVQFGWASGALATTFLTDYGQPADEEQIWSIWGGNARVKR